MQVLLTIGSIIAPLPTESDGESVAEAMPLRVRSRIEEPEKVDMGACVSDAEDEGDDEDEDGDGEM